MTAPMNNDEIFALLAECLADDRPPVEAQEAAYEAYRWRNIDAELAKLIEDSPIEVVGFRHGAYSRLLTYNSAQGTIEVGVADDTFEVVAIPTPVEVRAHRRSGLLDVTIDVELDSGGRGRGSGVSGSVRFEVVWPTGPVLTPWITL